ncbi:MAG: DUF4445 domain-containing protein [Anaerolineaceae bacterium]|nr:DUF4445 domain-containing protein [Anaerolineaceae bacterium]
MPFIVDFQPIGLRGEFSEEDTLLDCARQLGVDLVSICGGAGTCGRCKVQLINGQLTSLTPVEEKTLTEEEVRSGCRLACKSRPLSDVTIFVPSLSLTSPQRTQVEGLQVEVAPDPLIVSADVTLTPPTLGLAPADLNSLTAALLETGMEIHDIDYWVMKTLPDVLRRNNWKANVAIREGEIVAVGNPLSQWLGLAVDIGTTKVAGYLMDLSTGEVLASKGVMNPQISYGEDLISRIAATDRSKNGSEKLQRILVDGLNEMVQALCVETGRPPEEIVEAVVVGNTVIQHLFLGLPVHQLGVAPYTPVVDAAVDVKAREVGLGINPGGYVHVLPNIAGYVGGDHVAMLLATKLDQADEPTLAIDIGTNTEICLNYQGRLTSVSCASGPAFEGAHIKHGMRAAPGAIEYVQFENNTMKVQTIGGVPPVGICGSGLLDVVAHLRLNEVINASGRLGDHRLVRSDGSSKEFILAERPGAAPVTISQKDVRELQLAKAAIRVGIIALVENAGIEEKDIQKVIIAGAFGTFIDVHSAIIIGMLPDLPLDRFEQVGNAAGTGSRLALISKQERAKAGRLATQIGYIELARMPNFGQRFAEATFL